MHQKSASKGNKRQDIVGGKIYWIKRHLVTKRHDGFTPARDKKRLQEAIAALKSHNTSDASKLSISKEQNNDEAEDDFNTNPEVEENKLDCQTKGNQYNDGLSRTEEAKVHLDLGYFIVANHLPYNCVPKLLNFCQGLSMKYEAQLIERCHTSPTSMTKVINKCIGDSLRQKIMEKLIETPFALLIDASSNVYGGEYLAVLVRYINAEDESIQTKLIAVIELGSVTTGEELYKVM